MTKKTDADGNVVELDYDEAGNTIVEHDVTRGLTHRDGLRLPEPSCGTASDRSAPNAFTYITGFLYDDAGHSVTVTDPRGYETTTFLDGFDRVHRVEQDTGTELLVTTSYYDGNGNVERTEDAEGRETVLLYDGLNRLREVHHPLGLTTLYDYDGEGNKTEETNRRNLVTRFFYDNLGRPTRTEIDQPITDGGSTLAISQITYQDALRRRIETDARGNPTTYEMDEQGRVVTVTDPEGHEQHIQYDGVNKRADIDKRSNRTDYDYDAVNRLTKVTDAVAAGDHDRLRRRGPDRHRDRPEEPGQDDPARRRRKARLRHPLERRPRAARLRRQRQPDALDGRERKPDPVHLRRSEPAHPAHRRVRKSPPDVDGLHLRPGREPPHREGRPGHGKPLRRPERLRRPEPAHFRGGRRRQRHHLRVRRRRQPHRQGRPQGTDVPDRARLRGAERAHRSPDGRRRRLPVRLRLQPEPDDPDRRRRQRRHLHLRRSQPGRSHDPGSHGFDYITDHDYDPNGNETKLTDAKGQVVDFEYDELNRLKKKIYNLTAGDFELYTRTHEITYHYDPNDNLFQIDELKSSGTDPPALVSSFKSFDALDRLTSETDAWGRTLGYDYDPQGNRTLLVDPDNKRTVYGFDELNRLETITLDEGTPGAEIVTYEYFPDSLKKRVFNPNGTVSNYLYDAADRMVWIAHTGPTGTISSYDYAYDENGNREQQIETNAGRTETTLYDYDATDRLEMVTYEAGTATANQVSYTYDLVGNRLTERTVELATSTVTKDLTYAYDAINRLGSIDDLIGTEDVLYSYDPNGNTTSKTKNGVTTDVPLRHPESAGRGPAGRQRPRPVRLRQRGTAHPQDRRRGPTAVHVRPAERHHRSRPVESRRSASTTTVSTSSSASTTPSKVRVSSISTSSAQRSA